jgi:nucleoside-diphosphate-sugar epimerase
MCAIRASFEKITRELGYEPTVRFEEGLSRLYEWHEKLMYVVA